MTAKEVEALVTSPLKKAHKARPSFKEKGANNPFAPTSFTAHHLEKTKNQLQEYFQILAQSLVIGRKNEFGEDLASASLQFLEDLSQRQDGKITSTMTAKEYNSPHYSGSVYNIPGLDHITPLKNLPQTATKGFVETKQPQGKTFVLDFFGTQVCATECANNTTQQLI